MFYFKLFRPTLAIAISALLLFMSGCGGGGGDDDKTGSTPTLPSDAVTITDANATQVANAVLASIDSLSIVTSLKSETAAPSFQDAVNLVANKVFKRDRRPYPVVTGVTESIDCDNIGVGSITFTYTETETSASGTTEFNNCEFFGLTVDGSFTFSSSWNNTTGDYSDSGSGTLTYTYGSESFTIVMELDETGNEQTGAFSQSVSYSVTGSSVGGFLVTTTEPLIGNYFSGELTSGQLIVEGAGGTRLRITITGPYEATVELDDGSGTFVPHSTIP